CQYVLFIEALQPDIFLFENVSNFQSTLKTPTGYFDAPSALEELIDELATDELHYHVHHHVVNARNFAVHQDRSRFIMLGLKSSKGSVRVVREFFESQEGFEDVSLQTALMGLEKATPFDPQNEVKTGHLTPVYDCYDERLPVGQRTYIEWIQQAD